MIPFGDYMPHGMCLLWQPWLLTLWAGSDLLIFLSYTAIPIALLSVLRQRKDVPHSGLVLLFASFILLCGLTHLFGIVTLWYPIYPIVGWIKLATGAVSVTTAIVLFRLGPSLVALPSPQALAEVNHRLREEISAHGETLASLEKQVAERTRELSASNAMLAVQTREAVHRSANLLSVVMSLAVQTGRSKQMTEDFLESFLGRIQALANATKSIERKNESSIPLERLFDESLSMLEQTYGDRFAYSGPSLAINPEAAQQISLAIHELATNAQKYRLATSQSAQVETNWSITDDHFELVWREYDALGGDASGPAESEGFGTKLLTRVIPVMLRGEASRSFKNGGLVYRLRVPLDAVAADPAHGDSDRMAARIVDETFGLGAG